MRCFLEAPFLDILLALVLASNTSSYQVQSTCLSCGQLLTGATRPGSKAPFRQEMCKIFEVHCQKKTSFVLCRHISLDLFILPFHLALRPLTNNRPSFISMINYQNRNVVVRKSETFSLFWISMQAATPRGRFAQGRKGKYSSNKIIIQCNHFCLTTIVCSIL